MTDDPIKRDPSAAPPADRRRPWRWALAALFSLGALAVAIPNAAVLASARGRGYGSVESAPARRVGMVLGCSPTLANGRTNVYFAGRMETAAALFAAGRVERLLVSGDNGHRGYNEPAAMRAALLALGVPDDRIHLDFAGFRTLDSVVRAREVFGLDAVTLVSQRFHNERALFLAAACGLDAIAVHAPGGSGRAHAKLLGREVLARVRAALDVWVLGTEPRFLGPPVPIP